MEKASYMPTADTTDYSLCGSKPSCLQFEADLKQSLCLSYSQKIQQAQEKNEAAQSQITEKRTRRPSFVQLQSSMQVKIEKIIRKQIQNQGIVNRKMTLEMDQTCICTSDIYSKDNQHWKNRQITQLTTKRLDYLPVEQITKIKLLNQQPMAGYNLFRVTVGEKEVKDYAIRAIDIPLWFSSSIWVCLANLGHQVNAKRQFEGEIEGNILKKSQFLGNWQKRHVSISTKDGLMSYRKKDALVTVKLKDTTQLWTRLETVVFQDVKYVVIKTWQMMFKYQFGVPINDVIRWTKAFCALVK